MPYSATGTTPSPRAAHAAVSHQPYQLLVYGGATAAGGGLASDDLYLLDLKDNVGIWNTIVVSGKTPGRRYGHSLSYMKPDLVLFGGNVDSEMNDCWVLNSSRAPITWAEVRFQGAVPSPRVYHSAALCDSGVTKGMLLVFGGRCSKEAVGDTWGLTRHTDGRYEWLRAPEKGHVRPVGRYQHSCLFYGPVMVLVGGKSDRHDEAAPTQAYDVRTNKWTSFDPIACFRHCAFIHQTDLYLHGGFSAAEQQESVARTPPAPTDCLSKVSLSALLRGSAQELPSGRAEHGSPSGGRPPGKPPSSRENRLRILDPGQERPKKPLGGRGDLPAYFLNHLLQPHKYRDTQELHFSFRREHMLALCGSFQDVLREQPVLLKVQAPVKIFGDIHGQYSDLMSFLEFYGTPHEAGRSKDIENFDYLFLGDFVDRGTHSLETVLLLMALKLTYPRQVHLVRGNHEDANINAEMGFMEECAEKCQEDPELEASVYQTINRAFEWLPLAAVVEDSILCVHGGIGAHVRTLEDIASIQRPVQVQQEVDTQQQKVVLDLLWSDPTDNDGELGIQNNWVRDPNRTGNIFKFGPDVVQGFLQRNGLGMIIRAHECVMDGFERFANGQLITVFSATDYCRTHNNAGAILIVKTNLEIVPKLIKPNHNDKANWRHDEDLLKRRPPTPPRNARRL